MTRKRTADLVAASELSGALISSALTRHFHDGWFLSDSIAP